MASRPFFVLGDQTDYGWVVIEALVMTDTHGKSIARVGDQVTCPKRNHCTTVSDMLGVLFTAWRRRST